MANTPVYNVPLPDVGGSRNLWGTLNNTLHNTWDSLLGGSTPVTGIDINSGTIDGVTIGGAAPGAVSSTNLSYTGTLTGSTGILNIGSGQIVKDASGNVAIANASPSAWSTFKGLDLNTYGAVAASTSATVFAGNCYFNGTNWIYKQTGQASRIELVSGQLTAYTAPTGTAGDPITFTQAMTLTNSGNLLVGATVDVGVKGLFVDGVADGTNRGTVQVDRPSADGTRFHYAFVNTGDRAAGIGFNSSGHLVFGEGATPDDLSTGIVSEAAAGPLKLLTSSTERAQVTSGGNLRPGADNAYSLGEAAFRWSVVYSATGTINTSDERSKTDFAPTLGLDFITALEPVSYRYKVGRTIIEQVEDGTEEVLAVLDEEGNEIEPATIKPRYKSVERVVEGKRRHHGLKAQQVKVVLEQMGVDFAGWVIDDLENPDSQQGLRYDQFIAPLIKALQEANEKIEAQNTLLQELTQRITALEAK